MDLKGACIEELNTPSPDAADTTAKKAAAPYLRHIDQRGACSACLGGLVHALKRVASTKPLSQLEHPLCIGQGFKRVRGNGLGIGSCTGGFVKHVPGCPPSALEIRSFIETNWNLLHN